MGREWVADEPERSLMAPRRHRTVTVGVEQLFWDPRFVASPASAAELSRAATLARVVVPAYVLLAVGAFALVPGVVADHAVAALLGFLLTLGVLGAWVVRRRQRSVTAVRADYDAWCVRHDVPMLDLPVNPRQVARRALGRVPPAYDLGSHDPRRQPFSPGSRPPG